MPGLVVDPTLHNPAWKFSSDSLRILPSETAALELALPDFNFNEQLGRTVIRQAQGQLCRVRESQGR